MPNNIETQPTTIHVPAHRAPQVAQPPLDRPRQDDHAIEVSLPRPQSTQASRANLCFRAGRAFFRDPGSYLAGSLIAGATGGLFGGLGALAGSSGAVSNAWVVGGALVGAVGLPIVVAASATCCVACCR